MPMKNGGFEPSKYGLEPLKMKVLGSHSLRGGTLNSHDKCNFHPTAEPAAAPRANRSGMLMLQSMHQHLCSDRDQLTYNSYLLLILPIPSIGLVYLPTFG